VDLSELFSLDPERLDEVAKGDPVKKLVDQQLDPIPTIRMLWFLGRIADIAVFVADMLDVHGAAKSQIVRRMMHGVRDSVRGHVTVEKPEERDRAVEFMTKLMETEAKKKTDQYVPWLLNQGLVMVCTTMDVYLEHVVEAIFRKRNELLYSAAEAKTVDLRRVVELGSVDAIVASIREKEVQRFGFMDIDKRFAYLERHLHLLTGDAFSWKNFEPEVARRFDGWDLARLTAIYRDRHSVVHRDETPIRDRSDFEVIQDFMSKLILNISVIAKAKHDVWWDLDRIIAAGKLYPAIKTRLEGAGRGDECA
jgi:hypothetical protein